MAPILGADTAIGGAAYIASVIAAPGIIKHTSQFARMRFGRADKRPDAALQAFADAGKAAKLDIDLSADMECERWEKFIFLTAMSGATSALAFDRLARSWTTPRCAAFLPRADGRGLRGRQGQGHRARSRLLSTAAWIIW